MADWITMVMMKLGYVGGAFLMFLENVFPPIPSELIMPLAGTSLQGNLSFWGLVAAGTIGSVLGQLPLYYLGHVFGAKRLAQLADTYGRYLGVAGDDVLRSEAWFKRRAGLAVLLCRFVPGIRSLISLPAGSANMALLPFLAYSALGMGVWALVLAWIGRILGANYALIRKLPWASQLRGTWRPRLCGVGVAQAAPAEHAQGLSQVARGTPQVAASPHRRDLRHRGLQLQRARPRTTQAPSIGSGQARITDQQNDDGVLMQRDPT